MTGTRHADTALIRALDAERDAIRARLKVLATQKRAAKARLARVAYQEIVTAPIAPVKVSPFEYDDVDELAGPEDDPRFLLGEPKERPDPVPTAPFGDNL